MLLPSKPSSTILAKRPSSTPSGGRHSGPLWAHQHRIDDATKEEATTANFNEKGKATTYRHQRWQTEIFASVRMADVAFTRKYSKVLNPYGTGEFSKELDSNLVTTRVKGNLGIDELLGNISRSSKIFTKIVHLRTLVWISIEMGEKGAKPF